MLTQDLLLFDLITQDLSLFADLFRLNLVFIVVLDVKVQLFIFFARRFLLRLRLERFLLNVLLRLFVFVSIGLLVLMMLGFRI